MGQSRRNLLLHDVSGNIGKQIVVKQYGNKTFISVYPDMSKIKPSKQQKTKRKKFAAAVAYARSITNDPMKKALYAKKIKTGKRVYNYAIKEYLGKNDK